MKDFGTVEFAGVEYILTSDADFTGRVLEGGYTDYSTRENGEDYQFEMSANAKDQEGNSYTVYWIFTCTDDEAELDSYDYDNVDRVIEN